MRILITGGSGFVGSELIQQLMTTGPHHIINLDIHPSIWAVTEDHRVDITDGQKTSATIAACQPDIIYHLAAVHYIPYCAANPQETHRINVIGTENVLKAAQSCQRKPLVILASSAAVYAPNNKKYVETDPLKSIDIYGQTKIDVEKLARAYTTSIHGLSIITTRLQIYMARVIQHRT